MSSSRGAELIEISLVIPILLLLIMGAWDFGSAFLMQDKMTNAAREAARLSASNSMVNPDDPSMTCSSVSGATPCTIVASMDALKQYMTNAGVDLSCIDPNSPSSTVGLQYTYTCKSISGMSVIINRGAVVNVGTPPVALLSTQVTFSYPVTWWLAKLFPKGVLPANLTTVVTMRNLA